MFVALLSVMLFASETVATTNTTPATPIANGAASAPGAPQPPATAESAKEPKKICRRQPPITGQVRSKRICLTAEQWKAAGQ